MYFLYFYQAHGLDLTPSSGLTPKKTAATTFKKCTMMPPANCLLTSNPLFIKQLKIL